MIDDIRPLGAGEMVDELGNAVTPERVEALLRHFAFRSDTEAWEVGLVVKAMAADRDRLAADLAAARAASAEMRAALSHLVDIVEDARSVGEMQGEDFLMEPWASLQANADRYLPLLAREPDRRGAAIVKQARIVVGKADAWVLGCDESCDTDCDHFGKHSILSLVEGLRRALAPAPGGEG